MVIYWAWTLGGRQRRKKKKKRKTNRDKVWMEEIITSKKKTTPPAFELGGFYCHRFPIPSAPPPASSGTAFVPGNSSSLLATSTQTSVQCWQARHEIPSISVF